MILTPAAGRRVAAALATVALLGACTQIVGPARTRRDYELKASTTAECVVVRPDRADS